MLNVLSPRRGIFEDRPTWSMGFQGVLALPTEIYAAPWGNGWDRVPPASAPGFGSALGMELPRAIPRSDLGGRTPNMVGSKSAKPCIHFPELLVWVGWNRLEVLIRVGRRWSLLAQGLLSRSTLLPCGAPCRARLDLVH